MKKIVVAFDFDGTLTHSDSMLAYMKYVIGTSKFYLAILKSFPWILAYKLHLYPNWAAKQKLFTNCFYGFPIKELEDKSTAFAEKHQSLLRPKALSCLQQHIQKGHTVYIISASMEVWIKPLLQAFPSLHYLTTEPEIMNGRLTGHFATPNCYGKEKVTRLYEVEPHRDTYILYAYGDSRGDKELLAAADYPFYQTFPIQ